MNRKKEMNKLVKMNKVYLSLSVSMIQTWKHSMSQLMSKLQCKGAWNIICLDPFILTSVQTKVMQILWTVSLLSHLILHASCLVLCNVHVMIHWNIQLSHPDNDRTVTGDNDTQLRCKWRVWHKAMQTWPRGSLRMTPVLLSARELWACFWFQPQSHQLLGVLLNIILSLCRERTRTWPSYVYY